MNAFLGVILILSLVTEYAAGDSKFKLTGSAYGWQGNVLVHIGGNTYAHVCDKDWTINTANVICRELGFYEGASFIYFGSQFQTKKNEASNQIKWLCKGYEKNITMCPQEVVQQPCNKNEVAGVLCRHTSSTSETFNPPNCTFDKGPCEYKSNLAVEGDILWQRLTAKIKDESDVRGHYMYLMSEGRGLGTKGQLKSSNFTLSGHGEKLKCLNFLYYLASNNGTLRVYLHTHDKNSYPEVVWSLQQENQAKWLPAAVPLRLKQSNNTQRSQLIFEGVVGVGPENVIAIDNVALGTDTECKIIPKKATVLKEIRSPCKQRTVGGNCCIFPFTFGNETHNSCIQDKKGGKNRCLIKNITLTDKEEDKKEKLWDECQDETCQEKTINGSCCFSGVCREDSEGRSCYIDKQNKKKEACRGIRLAGDPVASSGVVQVYHKGRWGSICGDASWDLKDAEVICRELGFKGAEKFFKKNRTADSGPFWLQELNCNGNEPMLSLCLHRGWGVSNCNLNKLAAVVCKVAATTTTTTPHKTLATQISTKANGRVERILSVPERASTTVPTSSSSSSPSSTNTSLPMSTPRNWIQIVEYGGLLLLFVFAVVLCYYLGRKTLCVKGDLTTYTKVPSVSADDHHENKNESDTEKGSIRKKEKRLNKLASKNC